MPVSVCRGVTIIQRVSRAGTIIQHVSRARYSVVADRIQSPSNGKVSHLQTDPLKSKEIDSMLV